MNRASYIYQYLTTHGVNPVQAYGILGNMWVETGGTLSPTSYNSNEKAIGLIQWEGGRRAKLQEWASSHGGKETDLDIQLSFLIHEMNTGEANAWASVRSASTVTQAASLWDQNYERSSGEARQQRIDAANGFAGNLDWNGGGGNVATLAKAIPPPYKVTKVPDGTPGGSYITVGATKYYQSNPSVIPNNVIDGMAKYLTASGWDKDALDKSILEQWSSKKYNNGLTESNIKQGILSAYVEAVSNPSAFIPAQGKSWVENVGDAINGAVGWTESLSKGLGWLTTAKNWERIGVVALGAIILLVIVIKQLDVKVVPV